MRLKHGRPLGPITAPVRFDRLPDLCVNRGLTGYANHGRDVVDQALANRVTVWGDNPVHVRGGGGEHELARASDGLPALDGDWSQMTIALKSGQANAHEHDGAAMLRE